MSGTFDPDSNDCPVSLRLRFYLRKYHNEKKRGDVIVSMYFSSMHNMYVNDPWVNLIRPPLYVQWVELCIQSPTVAKSLILKNYKVWTSRISVIKFPPTKTPDASIPHYEVALERRAATSEPRECTRAEAMH